MKFPRSVSAKILFAILLLSPLNASADDRAKEQELEVESVRLMKGGEDEKALVVIEKALKLPHGPMLEKRKADCLLNLGRRKEALVVAKQVVQINPKNSEAHQTLSEIYAEMGLNTEALKEINIAVGGLPNDRGFRNSREKIYERQHEYAKAIEDLTIVINTAEPQNRTKPLERRANCHMFLKDYPKAIADLTAALSNSLGRSDLLRLRAQAYEKMGNNAAAQKDLKAAIAMDGDLEPPQTMGNRR